MPKTFLLPDNCIIRVSGMLLLFSFCIIVFHAIWLVSLPRVSSKPTLSAIVFIALALNHGFSLGFLA